jgi:replicative DNA helicase
MADGAALTQVALDDPRSVRADAIADRDAERAILGALVMDPESLYRITDLDPEDFSEPAHAAIYAAARDLTTGPARGFDVETLAAALRSRGQLNAVGGAQYLGEITDAIPTGTYIESHAQIVRDCARRRAVRFKAWALAAKAAQWEVSADDLEAELMAAATSARGSASREPPAEFSDLSVALCDSIIARSESGEAAHVGSPTPWPRVNAELLGLGPGELIVIAADTSVGKTVAASDIARETARSGKSVIFFSLEMPRAELFNRVLAAEAGLGLATIRMAVPTQDELNTLVRVTEATNGWRFKILFTPRITVAQIRIECLRRKASHGLHLVVVDYLQLITFSQRKGDSRNEASLLAEVTRELKILAGELMVPVVLLSQFNNGEGGDDKRPTVKRLRGSGAIGQDANAVMLLHRPPGQPKGPTEIVDLIVEKNRNGARGATISLTSEKAFLRFVDNGDGELSAQPRPDPREAEKFRPEDF